MNPIEIQVAEYFSWLESDVTQLEPIQHTSLDAPRTRWTLVLAVAAAVVAIAVGLSLVNRRADLAPGESPVESSTTVELSTVPNPNGAETTALGTVLSDAGVDMSRLPDTVVEAISDVASGATRLCGFEGPLSPRNETGVALNSAARRCFLDSYLIGSPAVLVLQGPTYLTAPGIQVWVSRADRNLTIDETSADSADGQDGGWTSEPCGGISTDAVSSADPPEYIRCTAAPFPLVAEQSEPPAWFVDRALIPLCGYSMPSNEDDGGAGCFADSLAVGEAAEYVIVGADGRSVAWMRSLDIEIYERIDWQVSSDGVASWTRSVCTRSDVPDATIPAGVDGPYSCEAT